MADISTDPRPASKRGDEAKDWEHNRRYVPSCRHYNFSFQNAARKSASSPHGGSGIAARKEELASPESPVFNLVTYLCDSSNGFHTWGEDESRADLPPRLHDGCLNMLSTPDGKAAVFYMINPDVSQKGCSVCGRGGGYIYDLLECGSTQNKPIIHVVPLIDRLKSVAEQNHRNGEHQEA
ncbi:hypothetical protein AOLI_G00081480 [Acnodon oligacanthus]